MITGNKQKALTAAFDALLDTFTDPVLGKARFNGQSFEPRDNRDDSVTLLDVRITVGNFTMTNAARKAFISAAIDIFDVASGPLSGFEVLAASWSYPTPNPGTVTVFFFTIKER